MSIAPKSSSLIAAMQSFKSQPLTLKDEYTILETCVGWNTVQCKERRSELSEYIGIYQAQISQLDLVYGLGCEQWPFKDKEHQQLIDIITQVRKLGPKVTKDDARHAVRAHMKLINVEDHIVDSLVDSAVRIWTLVNFRSSNDSSVGRGRPCIQWSHDNTFAATLTKVFQKSTTELTLSQRGLSPYFTAVNMVNICGLKIEWATTLDDHLSLDRHRKILRVFLFRNWLKAQVEQATTEGMNTQGQLQQGQTPTSPLIPHAPLPKALYEETNRTLDLLFPSWDPGTQRYLRKRDKDFHSVYSNPRLLDLKHYLYWKDRLLELNEDIFLAPPEGWSQLWRDRRDPQKLWTFWIALLVLFLTIVATVASIVQTWATLARS